MQRLLYINNYNCTNIHQKDYPDSHMWGADYLSKYFQVTCAKIPKDIIKSHTKIGRIVNGIYKRLMLFIKYYSFPIVYAACGDMTDMFAIGNLCNLGNRKLFMIQHHGGHPIRFSKGYTSIIFISSVIAELYPKLASRYLIEWGGDVEFALPYLALESKSLLKYDFISAGKSYRDYKCMVEAFNGIQGHAVIIAAVSGLDHDDSKITIISGSDPRKNSLTDNEVFSYYAKSKFVVIPCSKPTPFTQYTLKGLTSFVDAVIMQKPVLISDSTNMGIDVEKLGIGIVYKAGNVKDMHQKMLYLLRLDNNTYTQMSQKMYSYSLSHNYKVFCQKLYDTIKLNTNN